MSDRCGHTGLALTTNQGIQRTMANRQNTPEAVSWVGLVVFIIRLDGPVDPEDTLILCEVTIAYSLCTPSLGLEPTPQLHLSQQAAGPRILYPLHRDGHTVQTNLIRLSLPRRDNKR